MLVRSRSRSGAAGASQQGSLCSPPTCSKPQVGQAQQLVAAAHTRHCQGMQHSSAAGRTLQGQEQRELGMHSYLGPGTEE